MRNAFGFAKATARVVCAVLLIIGMAVTAAATNLSFTTEAGFLAAAGVVRFESFEEHVPRNVVGLVETIIADDFSLSHSGPTTESFDTLNVFNTPSQGQFATHGDHWVYARTHQIVSGAESIDFVFDAPVDALGFYITDLLDTPSGLRPELVLTTTTGQTWTVASGPRPSGTLAYIGVVTDIPFVQASLRSFLNQDGYGIDSVSISVIPEPRTLQQALLSLLLLNAGLIRIRRHPRLPLIPSRTADAPRRPNGEARARAARPVRLR